MGIKMIIDLISISIIVIFLFIGYRRTMIGLLLYVIYIIIWSFGLTYIIQFISLPLYHDKILFTLANIMLLIAWIIITGIIDPLIMYLSKKIPLIKSFGLIIGMMLGISFVSISYQIHVMYYQQNLQTWRAIIIPNEKYLKDIQSSYTHRVFYSINIKAIKYIINKL